MGKLRLKRRVPIYPNVPAHLNKICEGFMNVAASTVGPVPPDPVTGWVGNFAVDGSWDRAIQQYGVVDHTAPFGATQCYLHRYPVGQVGGSGAGGLYMWPGSETSVFYDEIYVARYEKFVGNGGPTPQYENHPIGTKFGWIGSGNDSGSNQSFVMLPNPTSTQGLFSSLHLGLYQQALFSGHPNRPQNGPNGALYPIVVGEWFLLEYYAKINSLASVNGPYSGIYGGSTDIMLADGLFKLWVTPLTNLGPSLLMLDYNDVCWRDSTYSNRFKFHNDNYTWGGGTNVSKVQQDDILMARMALFAA